MTRTAARTLPESSRVPLWTVDSATGDIADWNSEAADLCGWAQGGVARPFEDLAQLFMIDSAGALQRITLQNLLDLEARPRADRQLKVRLCRPGARNRHLLLQTLGTAEPVRRTWLFLCAISAQPDASPGPQTGALAAIVGHELNNISVPLQGFVALASQNPLLSAADRQSFDEIGICAERIKRIAALLESLAETDAVPNSVAIGECMPVEMDGRVVEAANIDWRCSATTKIAVDRLHARRAVESLARAAIGAVPRAPAGRLLTVSKGLPSGSSCVVCGAPSFDEEKLIVVTADGPRHVTEESLRDPLGSERAGRAVQRLTTAAVIHCTHRAGGHVFFDQESGSISIAFRSA